MFCSPPGPILQRDPGQLPTYPAPQQRGKQTTFIKYNTIRDGGSTALYTAYTVTLLNTVYTIQTALHCLNTSMFAYIQLLGKVRTLLEWANTLLNKKVEWMNG